MSDLRSGFRFAYRAFISYSHADKAWADWLHKALETYRVPSRLVGKETAAGIIPRRLNPIFRDRDELASAHDLGRKVNEALAKSEALVVICSPHSAQSRWVNEEVLAFKRTGRTERIFCLIVDGEPGATDKPGREAEECFCPALRCTLDANGQPTTERTEPIAADARPGKDGKANAELKLIAGLLDVGFDQLKQREQHRKMQRLVAVTSLALVVMAVTVVLAVFALISRHDAVIAQHKAVAAQHTAVVAQQAAERRQKQAEGLVNFMLGDLTDKLQAQSNLDILSSVDDRAMAYFKSLPSTDVNDTVLAQRAKALELIGTTRMHGDHPTAALAAFHASTSISSRLAAAAPANVARQAAYARTLTYIGMIHQRQDDLVAAQREYAQAAHVLQLSLMHAPNDLDLLEQLSYVRNNDGYALEASGHLEAAHAEYEAMTAMANKLIAADPHDNAFTEILISAHLNLESLAAEGGDLAAAMAESRAADTVGTTADDSIINNKSVGYYLQTGRETLGQVLSWTGDSESAVRGLQQASDMAWRLVVNDPKNMDSQRAWSHSSSLLARLQRLNGNLPAAIKLNTQAVATIEGLIRKHPSNHVGQVGYAETFTEQAAELRTSGNRNSARRSAQRALHILVPSLTEHPADRYTLLATMTAKLLLASVTEDVQSARALYEQALGTMQAVKIGREDPRLLALQVEALLALDRKPDAQPLIKRAWSSGYRDPGFVDVLRHAHIDYPPNPAFQARLLAVEARVQADAAPQASGKGNR